MIFTVSNAFLYRTSSVLLPYREVPAAGSVSPASLHARALPLGTFQVTVTAGQAGDERFSLHLWHGSSTYGSIPIIVRALVPLSSDRLSLSTASLTGGGATGTPARSSATSSSVPFPQAIPVPRHPASRPQLQPEWIPGLPERRATLRSATAQFYSKDHFLGFGPDHAVLPWRPVAGLRTPTPLVVTGPMDRAHLSEPFSGAISFTAASGDEPAGYRTPPRTVLPAGGPVTATITVTNTGNIRKDFFADARLNGRVPQLAARRGRARRAAAAVAVRPAELAGPDLTELAHASPLRARCRPHDGCLLSVLERPDRAPTPRTRCARGAGFSASASAIAAPSRPHYGPKPPI